MVTGHSYVSASISNRVYPNVRAVADELEGSVASLSNQLKLCQSIIIILNNLGRRKHFQLSSLRGISIQYSMWN